MELILSAQMITAPFHKLSLSLLDCASEVLSPSYGVFTRYGLVTWCEMCNFQAFFKKVKARLPLTLRDNV